MKKVLLTLTLALAFSLSYGQRIVDHAVRLHSPTANSTIRTGVPFSMTFSVTNNGPDMIKTTDTLIYLMAINGVAYPATAAILNLPSDLNMGDSSVFTVNNQTITGGNGATLNVCAYVVLNNRALPDSVRDNRLGGNNGSCVSINYSGVGIGELRVNAPTFESTVYPNPAKETVNIEYNAGLAEEVSINVYDMQGKVVSTYNTVTDSEGTQVALIDLSSFESGVYFYTINMDGKVSTNKFIVE